jgi:hypothetical protein
VVPPLWVLWLAEYVAAALDARDVPPALVGPFPTYPHVTVCSGCGEECWWLCPYCGDGVHGAACVERHLTRACAGEDHWPDWLRSDVETDHG